MKNKEKYVQIVSSSFNVSSNEVAQLKYQDVKTWDSVGHMAFIGELEDNFEIEMEIEDIIDFSSIEKGYEILGKYGVDFNA